MTISIYDPVWIKGEDVMGEMFTEISPTAETFAGELDAVLSLHKSAILQRFVAHEIETLITQIKEPPSNRRNRIIARMEQRAAKFLHKKAEEVNWPSLTLDQWLGIIKVLVGILSAILMLG